jgi:hypothetical protein
MDRIGEHHDEIWDEQDGFFYDVLRLPNGQATRLKVPSMMGLLPLCASTIVEADIATRYPRLMELVTLFKKRHPQLVSHVAPTDKGFVGYRDRRLFSVANRTKLERATGTGARLLARRERISETVRNPFGLSLSSGPSVLILCW